MLNYNITLDLIDYEFLEKNHYFRTNFSRKIKVIIVSILMCLVNYLFYLVLNAYRKLTISLH